MEITVKIKNVYGKELVYPVCGKAMMLAALTGSVTFTRAHLNCIQELGYKINVEAQKLAA